ncbi:hypothetical protein BKA82DRAFT_4019101 [Pisolithus tinctorius]|nr:hypothetical protein BKA82DRAFT_4019101 [Pisolithus tinctorius]
MYQRERDILKWSGAYIDAEEIWPMNYHAMLFTTEAKTNHQCDHSSNYTGNHTLSHITICAMVLVVPTSGLKDTFYQLPYQPGASNKVFIKFHSIDPVSLLFVDSIDPMSFDIFP